MQDHRRLFHHKKEIIHILARSWKLASGKIHRTAVFQICAKSMPIQLLRAFNLITYYKTIAT